MNETHNTNKAVENHYTRQNLLDVILEMLKKNGKDLNRLTVADLALVDALHTRGREATVELAGRAKLQPGSRVLDIGCGIGGSSRYLAAEHHCHVTGVDLTREFVETARTLAKMTGLEDSVDYHQCSALATPFDDHTFDAAWTEHAQMNIQDKHAFYSEINRVLKPGGRLLFHDVFQGSGGAPHFPLPWADEPSISFLAGTDAVRQLLSDYGFNLEDWEDRSNDSLKWFVAMNEKLKATGTAQNGPQLIMGKDAAPKLQNLARSLQEDRLAVVQAVATKS